MINVLVVEDSPVARELLLEIISQADDIHVLGTAATGEDAIKMNKELNPDLITMDVNLPKMNGLEATKNIMESRPVPIIIVSSGFEPYNIDHSVEVLKAGAVAIAKKPEAYGSEHFKADGDKLIQMIRLMSEIKVIKRKASGENKKHEPNIVQPNGKSNDKIELIGIGASTGGPAIIEEILSGLPDNFSIPVVIVQHIAQGFTEGFVEWLNQKSTLKVVVASDGMSVEPGYCYIAPDDFHLKIKYPDTLQLVNDDLVNGVKPSVSVFFESLVNTYGKNCLAILLSGMGKDGADKLKILKDVGAITIAQDSSSSLIFGMPGEAVKLKAAKYVMSKEEIKSYLNGIHLKSENAK
jgi:two-component system, chemotaxis family, protein-glutamate methylesterase/glutaminase